METARTIKKFKNQKGVAGVFFQVSLMPQAIALYTSCCSHIEGCFKM